MGLCVKEMFLHCRMGELHLLWQSVHSCASAVSSALQRLLCTCSAWSAAHQAFGHPTKVTRWSLLGPMMPTALLALKWCCLHCVGPAVRYSSLLKAKLVSLWFLAHPQTCAHRYLTCICHSWHSAKTLKLWCFWLVVAASCWGPGYQIFQEMCEIYRPCVLWDPNLHGFGRLFGNVLWTFTLSNVKCYCPAPLRFKNAYKTLSDIPVAIK